MYAKFKNALTQQSQQEKTDQPQSSLFNYEIDSINDVNKGQDLL